MSANPYAPTEHANGGMPRNLEGCPLAVENHRQLNGHGDHAGVFEQLRGLHAMVRVRGNLIVAGVWVIALCSAWSTYVR